MKPMSEAYLDQAKVMLDFVATCIECGQEIDNLQTILWGIHSLISQAQEGAS